MKFKSATITAVLLLLFTAAFAQEIQTDYDHSYDFSKVKTFAVKVVTPWGNPLMQQRAVDAITQELTSKGWTAADEATADVLVAVHGASETKKSLNTFYSGMGGWGWGMGGGTGTTTVSEYKVGTLLVDIFDAKDKKLVWRGTAQDEASDKPEKNTKKLEKGVEKLFKKFPPEPK